LRVAVRLLKEMIDVIQTSSLIKEILNSNLLLNIKHRFYIAMDYTIIMVLTEMKNIKATIGYVIH